MAWRPSRYLIEGELDNTKPGRITGGLSFVGLPQPVTLDLLGDFHRDIRGAKLRLKNPEPLAQYAAEEMDGFAMHQTGKAGDITAGLPPRDYVNYPYAEWYGENGRVVLEFEPHQVEVVGTPLPWQNERPIDRREQQENLQGFLLSFARGFSESAE